MHRSYLFLTRHAALLIHLLVLSSAASSVLLRLFPVLPLIVFSDWLMHRSYYFLILHAVFPVHPLFPSSASLPVLLTHLLFPFLTFALARLIRLDQPLSYFHADFFYPLLSQQVISIRFENERPSGADLRNYANNLISTAYYRNSFTKDMKLHITEDVVKDVIATYYDKVSHEE